MRSWNASSSGRWPTLITVASGICSLMSCISRSWLSGSSAEVASSSTIRSGLWMSSRAKARRCFSPPDSVCSHGPSSSSRSSRWPRPTASSAFAHLLVRHLVGGQRIGGGAAQRAERHIGLLRQHQQLGVALHHDLAFAPGPQPGDRAHQRALAGAGFADDQHLLAGRDVDLGLVHDAGAVVERSPTGRAAAAPSSSCWPREISLMPPAFSASSSASSDAISDATRRALAFQLAKRG